MSESLNGGSRSLPVSDPVETPAPSDQSVGMHAEKMGSDTQAAVSAKSGVASERKHSNARLIALRGMYICTPITHVACSTVNFHNLAT